MLPPDHPRPNAAEVGVNSSLTLQPFITALNRYQAFDSDAHPLMAKSPLSAAGIENQIHMALPILSTLEQFPNPREAAVAEVRGIIDGIKERAGTDVHAVGAEVGLLVRDLLFHEVPEGRQAVNAPLLRAVLEIVNPQVKLPKWILNNSTFMEAVAKDAMVALGAFVGDISYGQSISKRSAGGFMARRGAGVFAGDMLKAVETRLPALMNAAREAIPQTSGEVTHLRQVVTYVAESFGIDTTKPQR